MKVKRKGVERKKGIKREREREREEQDKEEVLAKKTRP